MTRNYSSFSILDTPCASTVIFSKYPNPVSHPIFVLSCYLYFPILPTLFCLPFPLSIIVGLQSSQYPVSIPSAIRAMILRSTGLEFAPCLGSIWSFLSVWNGSFGASNSFTRCNKRCHTQKHDNYEAH